MVPMQTEIRVVEQAIIAEPAPGSQQRQCQCWQLGVCGFSDSVNANRDRNGAECCRRYGECFHSDHGGGCIERHGSGHRDDLC